MQANPRTLGELFNSQLRYIVPMFQRLYVWQENPQWSTLWEDVTEKALLQLKGMKTNPHYCNGQQNLDSALGVFLGRLLK